MTQLVFVHGVATRTGDAYAAGVKNRDRLISEILFEGGSVDIHSPAWGDFVPKVDDEVFQTAAGVASFSLLGGFGSGGGGLGVEGGAGDGSVAQLAGQNTPAAVDAIFATLLETSEDEGKQIGDEEVALFKSAVETLADDGTFADLASDDELAMAMSEGQLGSFGIGSCLRDAIGAVADRIRNTASTLAFDAVRDRLSPAIALFLGDVFVYLKESDLREQIRGEVRSHILTAHDAARSAGEPLVLIGHSLGGVILCDMLGDVQKAGLPQDLDIACLVTVGSQPGLFGSLQTLEPGRAAASGTKRRLTSVRNWLNVFDPIDPLAFRADPIFDGVSDFSFDSVTGLVSAHTTYFKRPQFYARCRKRFRDAGVIEVA
jgi:hypothetical protein